MTNVLISCPKPITIRRPKARFVEPSIWDLRRERGRLCEWCKERPMEQRHHALIGDLKRFHKELTVIENLMGVCAYCHTGICVLDRREVRRMFYEVQCRRHGPDHMEDWVNSLSPKLQISGRIDFLPERNRHDTNRVFRV